MSNLQQQAYHATQYPPPPPGVPPAYSSQPSKHTAREASAVPIPSPSSHSVYAHPPYPQSPAQHHLQPTPQGSPLQGSPLQGSPLSAQQLSQAQMPHVSFSDQQSCYFGQGQPSYTSAPMQYHQPHYAYPQGAQSHHAGIANGYPFGEPLPGRPRLDPRTISGSSQYSNLSTSSRASSRKSHHSNRSGRSSHQSHHSHTSYDDSVSDDSEDEYSAAEAYERRKLRARRHKNEDRERRREKRKEKEARDGTRPTIGDSVYAVFGSLREVMGSGKA